MFRKINLFKSKLFIITFSKMVLLSKNLVYKKSIFLILIIIFTSCYSSVSLNYKYEIKNKALCNNNGLLIIIAKDERSIIFGKGKKEGKFFVFSDNIFSITEDMATNIAYLIGRDIREYNLFSNVEITKKQSYLSGTENSEIFSDGSGKYLLELKIKEFNGKRHLSKLIIINYALLLVNPFWAIMFPSGCTHIGTTIIEAKFFNLTNGELIFEEVFFSEEKEKTSGCGSYFTAKRAIKSLADVSKKIIKEIEKKICYIKTEGGQ